MVDNEKYFPVQNLQANKLGSEVYDIVMEAINQKDLEYWDKVFIEADIPFAVAKNWMEIRNDKQAEANNCFYDMTYENGNTRRLVRPPVKFTEMGVPEYKRGPFIGENGREVLKEIGYSDEAVDKLLEKHFIYGKNS